MRILFLGDVVGRWARKAVMDAIPDLRRDARLDFVVVNVENSAGGFGVTPDIAEAFLAAGADVMTTGNHVWDKREIFEYIDNEPRLLRPHNMPPNTPGKGVAVVTNGDGRRLAVANLICNLFMSGYEPVFPALAEILEANQLVRDADALVIDVHGEATSEKAAIGFAADGAASLVVGTHTHVPTADERILPGGTAYMTDAGMCGCYHSVIGMDPEGALARFVGEGERSRLEVAKGEVTLAGVLVETDDATGLATSVAPFRRGGLIEGREA